MIQCPIFKKAKEWKDCHDNKNWTKASQSFFPIQTCVKCGRKEEITEKNHESKKAVVYGAYFEGEMYSELKPPHSQGVYDIGVSLYIDGYQFKDST